MYITYPRPGRSNTIPAKMRRREVASEEETFFATSRLRDSGFWRERLRLLDLQIPQPAGVFATFQAAAQAAAVGAFLARLFAGLLFGGPLGALQTQADLALV